MEDHEPVFVIVFRQQNVAPVGAGGHEMGRRGVAKMIAAAGNAPIAVEHPHLAGGTIDDQDIAAKLLGDENFVRFEGVFLGGVGTAEFALSHARVAGAVGPQDMPVEERHGFAKGRFERRFHVAVHLFSLS